MTRASKFIFCAMLLSWWTIPAQRGLAQSADQSGPSEGLPSTPQPQLARNSSRMVVGAMVQVAQAASDPQRGGSQMASVDGASGAAGANDRVHRYL